MTYISREAAIDAIWKPEVRPNALIFDALRRACEEEVKHIPAADVRPVAEGHWLTWEEMFPDQNPRRKNNLGVFCSACKKHADNMTDFCPNCGADMRVERVKEAEE